VGRGTETYRKRENRGKDKVRKKKNTEKERKIETRDGY
jgi:hypothetical protein